jgi:hypothetical protein
MPETKIIYSGFYDAPLAFVTSHENKQYLFWRGFFDDELDDYPSEYEVFTLPNLSEAEIKGSWSFLSEKAQERVGKIDLNQVVFDSTKKLSIDTVTFERIVR